MKWSLMALLIVGWYGVAHADKKASAQTQKKAKAHFKQGKAFQEAKEYDEAISEYEHAFELVPIPELLFNMGQCRRLQGDRPKAIQAYRRYLELKPEGTASDEARAYVATLSHEEKSQKSSPKGASSPLDDLSMFEGRWKCQGSGKDATGHDHSILAFVEGTRTEGAYSFVYREDKTPNNPNPVSSTDRWSWEAAHNQFILVSKDNSGNDLSATSKGWRENDLLWEGELSNGKQRLPLHQTFSRRGERELTISMELQLNGNWLQVGRETCQKL